MVNGFLAFIVVLGVLIFFHELGHFAFARLFGVGVEKFSLGFGPRLFGKTVGITDYRVSAIPLGGYVKMVGEEPDAEIKPEDIPISFTHKPVWQRIIIVAAGPLSNLALAVAIFFAVFLITGTYILKPVIGSVESNSPAEQAGLQKGDVIVEIDGNPIASWDELAERIMQSGGKTLQLTVLREGKVKPRMITPQQKTTKNLFGEDIQRYLIGVTALGETVVKPMNPADAFTESIYRTWKISELTILTIVKMVQGSVSPKTLGGPIMIAQMAGEQAKEGAGNLVFFIALLSVNLGILNFLPIPVLDGGHLLFYFIEIAIRRPLNKQMRERAQQAGIFVLMLLMLYVFYNDISRILFS